MDLGQIVLVMSGQVFMAGAVYGGIRVELRTHSERIAELSRRMDEHLKSDQDNWREIWPYVERRKNRAQAT